MTHPPSKTYPMRCPHCKKTTQCKQTNAKPGLRKGPRRFICTECGMGWALDMGGRFGPKFPTGKR